MHVLWCLFKHPVSRSRVRDTVDWHSLEPSPSQLEDKRVIGFEYLLVPSVSLDSNLNEPKSIFRGCNTADNDGMSGIKGRTELVRNIGQNDASVRACLVPFYPDSG